MSFYRFVCVRQEKDVPFWDQSVCKLFYFLEDDSVAVKELKEERGGRDHVSMLLKRTKLLGGNLGGFVRGISREFESIFVSDTVSCSPSKLRIGEIINVFSNQFLLIDCDQFTRQYSADVLKNPQPEAVNIKRPKRSQPKIVGSRIQLVDNWF